jgi:chemotaxis protein methyltransferase CheR
MHTDKTSDYFGFGNLSLSDFKRLGQFIYTHFGIDLPPKKHYLLQARLVKRLMALNMASYGEYTDYVLKNGLKGDEVFEMIDVVSTNKTDFFRDRAHFDFIVQSLVPKWKGMTIRAWSAGCSSGQEVYTLAMVLQEAKTEKKIVDFDLLGSDISETVLQKARTAIYPYREVVNIPETYRKKYLLRSRNTEKPQIRIVPALRAKARFILLNLVSEKFPVRNDYHIIFCRNTLIYFDQQTQQRVVNHLVDHLLVGGFFFIGFSESLLNMDIKSMGLQLIKPTIYQKIKKS